jgi:hypothetical protein
MVDLGEAAEAKVLAIVDADGQYVGKLGCLLCLPLRRAAARLTKQGQLTYVGQFDGKQVWAKPEGASHE